ncbi:hypothetical protein DFH29DRAFT_1005212 [Suillus ampliporus]|nr:hypothetical protein DFH29DRAFT_1005212 [Suillus ampliporus]
MVYASAKRSFTPKKTKESLSAVSFGDTSQETATHLKTYAEPADLVLRIDAKHPENSMLYFPTNDEWTQVMLPPKPVPYRKTITQQPTAPHHRPTYHQTNLPFKTGRPNRGTPTGGRGGPTHRGFSSPRRPPPNAAVSGSNSILLPQNRRHERTPPPPDYVPPTPLTQGANPTPLNTPLDAHGRHHHHRHLLKPIEPTDPHPS